MTLANRWMRAPHGDPPELVIDLDPQEIERKKAQRLYRLNVVKIPTLRILGFCLLTFCVFFHNLLILESSSQPRISVMASVVISYSLISWLVLYFYFEKINK